MLSLRRLVPLLIVAISSFAAPPARADKRTDAARGHYTQADAYYKLDRFREALGEYEKAYIAKPDPSFLFNIGQCHRQMGNKREAIKFYRRYLRDQDESPNRANAEKLIHDLEGQLATESPAGQGSPPAPETGGSGGGAAGFASGSSSPQAARPASAAASLSQSTPTIASPAPASAPASGSTPTLAASPPPAEPAAGLKVRVPEGGATEEKHSPFYKRWWFWTAVGAVIVGGVLIGVAASKGSDCEAGRVCQ